MGSISEKERGMGEACLVYQEEPMWDCYGSVCLG